MTNMAELAKQLMSILSSWIKEVIKKKQHVCKLHIWYLLNTPKRGNAFAIISSRGLTFVDKTHSSIFFEQRKLNSYKTAIKALN